MMNVDVLTLEDATTTQSHSRGMERLILYLVSYIKAKGQGQNVTVL